MCCFCAGQCFPYFHDYSISALFCSFPLCSIRFHFSLYSALFCSDFLYFIAFCSVPYCSAVICSLLFHIILSGLFHSLLFHCGNSPPIFLFSFSHFTSGQFLLVHLSPAPFVLYPSRFFTVPLVILDTLGPLFAQLHSLAVLTDLNAVIPVCVI